MGPKEPSTCHNRQRNRSHCEHAVTFTKLSRLYRSTAFGDPISISWNAMNAVLLTATLSAPDLGMGERGENLSAVPEKDPATTNTQLAF